jgi:hypothetical protein
MRFFRLPSGISRIDLFQGSRENQGSTPLTLKTVSTNVTIRPYERDDLPQKTYC